jgi:hypothetical protein
MENVLALSESKGNIKSIFLDIIALAFIYFVPAISHLFNFPVYLVEPMRIMLILSLAHSGRINNYAIALTLPLFSFLISSHPAVLKTALITIELGLNVFLFYYISGKIKNNFVSMLLSIVISKWAYYFLKYIFLQTGLMEGELVATPVIYQIVTTLLFSLYIYFILGRKDKLA